MLFLVLCCVVCQAKRMSFGILAPHHQLIAGLARSCKCSK